MNEIWIEIVDSGGRYSVSNFGNVQSNWSDIPQRGLTHRIKVDKIKQLQPWIHSTGYLRVALGRGKYRYVHRLVAQGFLQNPENLPQVDHVDGNRQNNHVSNLRWVTAKQNSGYGGERHNWESQKIASAKRRIHEVRRQEYLALLNQGYSLRQIAKLFGTSHSAISNALKDCIA
jgi:hypothetical protein